MLSNRVELSFTNDESIKQVFIWYLEQIRQRFMSRIDCLLRPMNAGCWQAQNNIWAQRAIFVVRYGELVMTLGKLKDGKPINGKNFHDLATLLNQLNKFEEMIYTEWLKLKEIINANPQVAGNQQAAGNERDSEIQLINTIP